MGHRLTGQCQGSEVRVKGSEIVGHRSEVSQSQSSQRSEVTCHRSQATGQGKTLDIRFHRSQVTSQSSQLSQ